MIERFLRMGTMIGAALVLALSAAAAPAAEPAATADWPPYATVRDETSLYIRWRTAEPSQDRLILYGDGAKKELGTFAEKAPLQAHRVLLEGLKPGALYPYRISGTKNAGMEGQLRVPRQGRELNFFVIGDTQALTEPGTLDMELSRQRLTVDAIAGDPVPGDFLVHTGDLVESGNLPEWNGFFHLIAPLTSRMPLFAVKGNHDDRTGRFVEAFAFPLGEKPYGTDWHHFATENALFIFLNLNFSSIPQVSETDYWLSLVLEQFKDRKWKFVFTHQPIYSNVERDSDTPYRALFEPLFIKYGVDVVFSGHHHAYQRISRNGVTYIVSGGGGAATYSPLMDRRLEGTAKTEEKTLHYLRGRILGDTFVLDVRLVGRENQPGNVERADGEIDRFERTKP
ncbi:MAG: Calcineurin-like phosphoesterase [Syntrophaceae bacterium PtaU1.Bin231]|nr:MAG: Calcineurin-like phosphoesterase [Syntrophaceae bacterium PtaU1.Bin231]HOG17860.1 metallophosphoesterase family protein [Syntrophales bacterium]